MRLFAIGDPHLSFGRPKPMDVFGEKWTDHAARLAERWDARVGPEDVVAVAGDISWARNAREVAPDLEFLAARPGRLKLLLRGNHDSWWTSATKVRSMLPPRFAALQNDALRLPEGIVLCGARGWTTPGMPWADSDQDPPVYHRELGRLALSLRDAARLRQPGDRVVAILHYPPLGPGETRSEVVDLLATAGVSVAVYGHLHGADHAWAPRGTFEGVDLVFVAGDYTGFEPVEVCSAGG